MVKGTISLLVLYEHELRTAARLLNECVESQETNEFPDNAQAALNACIVALHGLATHPEGAAVMLSATDRLIGQLKQESKKKKR